MSKKVDDFWTNDRINSFLNLNSNNLKQPIEQMSSENCYLVCSKHLALLKTIPTVQILAMNRTRRTQRLLSPTFKRKIQIKRKTTYSPFLRSFFQNSNYSDDMENLLSPNNSSEFYSRIIHVKDEYEDITSPNPLILNMSQATKQMIFEENAQPTIYLDRLVFE